MSQLAINGFYVESEYPGIESMQLGMGLFETIKLDNGRPEFWDLHIQRLQKSAQYLGLDQGFNLKFIEKTTFQLLEQRPLAHDVMKITWIPGSQGTLIHSFRENPYTDVQKKQGIKVCLGSIRRNAHSHVVSHKTINYYDNVIERKNAWKKGCNEAFVLNTEGFLSEGTATNIFFFEQDRCYTPHTSCGLLPGIMRSYVISTLSAAGYSVDEGEYTLERIRKASFIFATNALMGMMPVSNFDGNCYDVNMNIVETINL